MKEFVLSLFILSCLTSPSLAWQLIPSDKTPQTDRSVLHLVFTPLNYEKKDGFAQDVSWLTAALRKTPPFDEIRDGNTYILSLSIPEQGSYLQKTSAFPFLEISEGLLAEIQARLHAPYKLIVLDKDGSVTAAQLSDVDHVSVVILGKNSYPSSERLARIFLHELGHSLGLREESPKVSQPILAGPPNCAPDRETASQWWGDLIGKIQRVDYFAFDYQGKVFIKPTAESLMSDPFHAPAYGPVNERYLRRQLELEAGSKAK